MSYVEDDCTTCGKILPRKDFHTWDEDVVVARESGTTQRFANGARGYREGKTTYRRVTRRLCPECWTEREEALRLAAEAAAAKLSADRTRALLVGGVIAVVLIALIGWIALSGSSASTSTNEAAPTASAPSNELATTNAAEPSAPLVATVAVSITDGVQPTVTGTTNLPDGTILEIFMSGPFPNCVASASCEVFAPAPVPVNIAGIDTASAVVHAGRFRAGPPWSPAPQPGTYKLWVTTLFSGLQPPAVQAVIGDKGQYMQGDLVDACPSTTPQTPAQIEGQAEVGHEICFQTPVTLASQPDSGADAEPDETPVPPPPPGGLTLSAAVESALETGQATPWRDGADSGVVSVGEIRIWRERPCRTYGFTTNGVRSPAEVSCRSPDSRWHPVEAYSSAAAAPAGPN